MKFAMILMVLLAPTKWFTLAPDEEKSPDPTPARGCQCGCGKLECKCGKTAAVAKCPDAVSFRRIQCEFWTATWCQPCPKAKADLTSKSGEWPLGPEWEVSESATAHFRLIDYDKNRSLAEQRGVKTLPAFVITMDGKPVATHFGYPGRKKLVQEFLAASKKLSE